MNVPRLMSRLKAHETATVMDAVGEFVIGDRVHEMGVEAKTRAIYVFGIAIGFLLRTGVIDGDEAVILAKAFRLPGEKG